MDTIAEAPFFSIILPVYNGEKFISETVQSILQQSFTAWELIIVDDGSTDKTPDIIRNFCCSDQRIKLIQQSNKQQAAARNTGMKMSSGQWIAFIDADDLWLPAKLELQYQCIKNDKTLDVVFSDGYTKYQDKRIKYYYHFEVAKGFFRGKDLYPTMLFGNYIPNLSAVVRSSWNAIIGMQDESLTGAEDHDYWLKLCRAGANFYGMKERLFIYRIHDSNHSLHLANKHYLSLLARINNFDRKLLREEEIGRFKKFVIVYLRRFSMQGKTQWVKDLKIEFKKLGIAPITSVDQMAEKWSRAIEIIKFIIERTRKRFNFYMLKTFYFYPRKKLSDYRERFATLYTNWLNSRNIENPAAVKMSATAKIHFYNNKGSSLDVQSMYLGEFSLINFMEEESVLIAGADLLIGKFCNFNIVGQVILGNNVLFNNYSTLNCHQEIVIGDDTWFGEGVKLYDHNHKYKDKNIPFTQQGYSNGRIEIGNNVWVGSNTVILQNVSIGDGCVIGANNVVYKSLAPNTILKSNSTGVAETFR